MQRHLFPIALFSTFGFAAGCATSGAGGNTESPASAASTADSQAHHARGLCTPSSTSAAPASGLVAEFSAAGDSQEPVPGKIVTYSIPKVADAGAFNYTAAGGNLMIKINAPATSRPQLLGTMFEFNSCVDASAFSGVQFTISGSFSGCSLNYGTGDIVHEDVTVSGTFAAGPAGAYVPQHKIAAADLSSTPKTIKLPFTSTDIQGNPPTPIDATKLIFTLWQFIVPVAADDGSATPPCTANVTIDDVRFYR
jgi:hypothetical protein